MINVAINGFGRIGRLVLRIGIEDPDINFVAINDLTEPKILAHLLKYDSVHGKFNGTVQCTDDYLLVNGKEIKVYSEKNPEKLPWKGIDVVVESTGRFRDREGASKHLKAGAKKVLISAPAKDPDITIVKGVNEHLYDKGKHHIISNASCTTNSLAPIVKVLHDNFSVKRGFMTTVHSVTNDQKILDLPHKDLRRARAYGNSIIPTTTGAAKAVAATIPEMEGRLDGMAIRVPTQDGSITDLTCELEREVTIEEIHKLFKNLSEHHLKEVLEFSEEPLVSIDIVGNLHSCIIDSLSTKVNGNMVKILAWYDNEFGYSNRMVDVIKLL